MDEGKSKLYIICGIISLFSLLSSVNNHAHRVVSTGQMLLFKKTIKATNWDEGEVIGYELILNSDKLSIILYHPNYSIASLEFTLVVL